jgi:hypothetical protein
MMIGIGRDQFAIRTESLERAHASLTIDFPVDVRALVVRVDEDARANIRGLVIEPARLVLGRERVTSEFARHAVRYGEATLYFLDEQSFPEREGFWIGGSRTSQIVVQPDAPQVTQTLRLRNGPAENSLLVTAKGWREELRLAPGEERLLEVPLDHARGATLLRFTTSSGFRPSAVDPRSQDARFLGVWVRVGE